MSSADIADQYLVYTDVLNRVMDQIDNEKHTCDSITVEKQQEWQEFLDQCNSYLDDLELDGSIFIKHLDRERIATSTWRSLFNMFDIAVERHAEWLQIFNSYALDLKHKQACRDFYNEAEFECLGFHVDVWNRKMDKELHFMKHVYRSDQNTWFKTWSKSWSEIWSKSYDVSIMNNIFVKYQSWRDGETKMGYINQPVVRTKKLLCNFQSDWKFEDNNFWSRYGYYR